MDDSRVGSEQSVSLQAQLLGWRAFGPEGKVELPVAAQEGQGYETSIGGVWLGRPLDEALLVRFLASLPADARPEGVDARDLEVTCNGTIVDRTARACLRT